MNGTIFGGKKKFAEHQVGVLIFSTTFASNISHSNKGQAWSVGNGFSSFYY
jgi:hypothetical protein